MERCGQSTGVVLEFEQAAIRGEPMPENLDLVDQLMFQALSLLYVRYRRKELSRDEATMEKGKLLYTYDRYKRQWESALHLAKWHFELVKATEGALNSFRKDHTIDAADRLADTLDGKIFKSEESSLNSIQKSPKSL